MNFFKSSNLLSNEFGLRAEFDYDQNLEAEVNYNRYLNDWVRLYVILIPKHQHQMNYI